MNHQKAKDSDNNPNQNKSAVIVNAIILYTDDNVSNIQQHN